MIHVKHAPRTRPGRGPRFHTFTDAATTRTVPPYAPRLVIPLEQRRALGNMIRRDIHALALILSLDSMPAGTDGSPTAVPASERNRPSGEGAIDNPVEGGSHPAGPRFRRTETDRGRETGPGHCRRARRRHHPTRLISPVLSGRAGVSSPHRAFAKTWDLNGRMAGTGAARLHGRDDRIS